MKQPYLTEPTGQRSRRLYFQAVENYSNYVYMGYLKNLFKAQEFFRQAEELNANNKNDYIRGACLMYNVSLTQFAKAMNS